jgi:hypothetical protein
LTFANVASAIALFIAISGGTAVALSGTNTVFTDDIANDTVPASGGNPAGGLVAGDLRPNSVGSSEVADQSLGNGDFLTGSVDSRVVTDGSLTSADIANPSLGNGDFLTGSVDSRVVTDNSLTGSDVSLNSLTGNDINESTLVGVKDGDSCISGAARFGRLCAGSDGVNRNLFAAFNSCASIGLRLPTWGEAVLLAVNYDVPGVGAFPARFWTDEITQVVYGPRRFTVMAVDEDGAGVETYDYDTLETVCVTNPD